MTITTELKVMNNVGAKKNTVKVSSNCSKFLTLHHDKLPDGKLELDAQELREFLFRTLPAEAMNQMQGL